MLTQLHFSGAELGSVSVKLPSLSMLMETGACGVSGACAAGRVAQECDSDSGNATIPRKSSHHADFFLHVAFRQTLLQEFNEEMSSRAAWGTRDLVLPARTRSESRSDFGAKHVL